MFFYCYKNSKQWEKIFLENVLNQNKWGLHEEEFEPMFCFMGESSNDMEP